MFHGKNRIPYRIDRRLTGLAGPEYAATISFGLPFEPEDSQYGESRLRVVTNLDDTQMSERPEPTPVALYARVSSDRQDVDLSVAAQLCRPCLWDVSAPV